MIIIALVIRQKNGTEDMAKKITHFLNYFTTHLGLTIRYKWSGIQIYIYSDAYYL